MNRRILIVEDEVKTAETVRLYLDNAGFLPEVATDGRAGLIRALSGDFALVVLDVMLPEVDGWTICSRLRRESDVRILMLTAKSTEPDRVGGLDRGADDYLTKPFSPRELVARVRAVLRRADPIEWSGPLRLSHRGMEIDLERHEVAVDGRRIDLTTTELRLLRTLARTPGRVFTREQLVEAALGRDFEGSERTIDAHIRNLRKKVEPGRPDRPYIETVFGVGYRLGAGR